MVVSCYIDISVKTKKVLYNESAFAVSSTSLIQYAQMNSQPQTLCCLLTGYGAGAGVKPPKYGEMFPLLFFLNIISIFFD